MEKHLALHMPLSFRDAEHPGGLISSHVTPLGWPMGEGEGFVTTWPTDLTVSCLVLHIQTTLKAGAGALKITVVLLSPVGD